MMEGGGATEDELILSSDLRSSPCTYRSLLLAKGWGQMRM